MSISTLIIFVSLTIGIGKLFDNILNGENIKKIKDTIFDLWTKIDEFTYAESIKSTNRYILQLFDNIYGKKYIGLKSFYRSLLMSALFFSVNLIIQNIFNSKFELFNFSSPTNRAFTINVIYKGLLVLFCYNLLIDYISIIQTRLFLKLTNGASLFKLSFFLILDIVVTGLLFLLPWMAITDKTNAFTINIPAEFYPGSNHISDKNTNYSLEIVLVGLGGSIWIAGFFSTFSTSLIFYVFYIFSMLLKIISYLKVPIGKFLDILYSKENPITTLTGILSALVIIIESIRKLTG